jgi:hypothetical protein
MEVADRLIELINNPDLLNQGANGLCGEAVFFNVWIHENPLAFARFATQLYNSGAAAIGDLHVFAGEDLRKQDYVKILDQMHPGASAMTPQQRAKLSRVVPPADWMVMSALRDSENFVLDYEGTPSEDWSAGTSNREIVKWLEATGLFRTVSNEAGSSTRPFSHAAGLDPGPGPIVILTIDSHMLGNPLEGDPDDNHFVVLHSKITEIDAVHVDFKYWCWADPTQWVSERRARLHPPLGPLEKAQFIREYFGAIIATPK